MNANDYVIKQLIKKGVPRPLERAKPPREKSTERLCVEAEEALTALQKRVSTDEVGRWGNVTGEKLDPQALLRYALLLRRHVEILNTQYAAHPKRHEHLRPLSELCENWPILIGRRKVFSDNLDLILSNLRIGAKVPYANNSDARFNPGNKFSKVLFEVIQHIDICRTGKNLTAYGRQLPHCYFSVRSLPPLEMGMQKSAITQWELAIKTVLRKKMAHPEEGDRLKKLVSLARLPRWQVCVTNEVMQAFGALWGRNRPSQKSRI